MLTECNAAMLKAGCHVRIIKGQQTGLIGKVHDVSEDIIVVNMGERHINVMFSKSISITNLSQLNILPLE